LWSTILDYSEKNDNRRLINNVYLLYSKYLIWSLSLLKRMERQAARSICFQTKWYIDQITDSQEPPQDNWKVKLKQQPYYFSWPAGSGKKVAPGIRHSLGKDVLEYPFQPLFKIHWWNWKNLSRIFDAAENSNGYYFWWADALFGKRLRWKIVMIAMLTRVKLFITHIENYNGLVILICP